MGSTPRKPRALRSRKRTTHAYTSDSSSETSLRRTRQSRRRRLKDEKLPDPAQNDIGTYPSLRSDFFLDMPCQGYDSTRSNGVGLAWNQLPYEIIRSILYFASYPLLDAHYQPLQSLNWLIATARTCRSFAEPALSVLYETPPLYSIEKPHRLLNLLKAPPSELLVDYKIKIKHLKLDTNRTLAYSMPGSGCFLISNLIPLLPHLSTIDIGNARDRPPYRLLHTKNGLWSYPQAMFAAMEQSGTRLRQWRWNGDMLQGITHEIARIHSSNAFQHLRHVSLSQITFVEEFLETSKSPKSAVPIQSLLPLKKLESITLQNCASNHWESLIRLPWKLVQVQIAHCNDFSTENICLFLHLCGTLLRSLTLNHNQSLSLDFLPELASLCPMLEILEADFTLYSTFFTHKQGCEPLYDNLLSPGSIPTWPGNLQSVSLLHLRMWQRETAESFFNSLIASASDLSQLSNLTLHMMLDIPWRERAEFRERWIGLLKETFLCQLEPPCPHIIPKKMSRQRADIDIRKQRARSTGKTNTSRQSRRVAATGHGSCNTVYITIDNLRPTEFMFSEADFLD